MLFSDVRSGTIKGRCVLTQRRPRLLWQVPHVGQGPLPTMGEPVGEAGHLALHAPLGILRDHRVPPAVRDFHVPTISNHLSVGRWGCAGPAPGQSQPAPVSGSTGVSHLCGTDRQGRLPSQCSVVFKLAPVLNAAF